MAKRFTDTAKWRKPFLRSMPAAYKLFWLYICDDCDHAGIWQVDMEVAKIYIGEELDYTKAIEIFAGRVIPFDENTKWFIPSFIEFQYPGELNEKNKVHNSVLSTLKKYGLIQGANKGLVWGLEAPKDKDKEKDKEKDIKEGVKGEEVFGHVVGVKPGIEDLGHTLPEIRVGMVVQYFVATKQIEVKNEQVNGLWEVFKGQYFNGKHFHKDWDDVYSHFLNWSYKQKITNGNPKAGTGKALNSRNGGLQIVLDGLREGIHEINARGTTNPGNEIQV